MISKFPLCRYVCTFALFLIPFIDGAVIAGNYYIDPSLPNPSLIESAAATSDPQTFHFFSHGRPGALLVNGKWVSGHTLENLLADYKSAHPQIKQINIYGCNFAKGTVGRNAVRTLREELGIDIAASNDITGADGDWQLELGDTRNTGLQINDLPYNLQTICTTKSYATALKSGWSSAPSSPSYTPPCSGSNTGSTTNGTGADGGFDTWYDSPSGYAWSRTLSGLSSAKTYRVYINMYNTSGPTDKRDAYFNNYNLAGKTGSFTAKGNTNATSQVIYDFEVTNKTSLSFTGTIQAAGWSGCEQAENYRVFISVAEVILTPKFTAPTISTTAVSNVCPRTDSDLSTVVTSTCGTGTVLEWHTTNTGYSNATKVADPTHVSNGTYYAVCHDQTNNCYSPASEGVTVTNETCIDAIDDSKSGVKNEPVNGSVLDNDINPSNRPLTVSTTPVSGPTHGTVVITSDGKYTYTPNAEFEGTDTFVYSVCDNRMPPSCDQATVTITINGKTLPVNLLKFEVGADINGNRITWKTSDEVNFDKFLIEKASDTPKEFITIGEVKGGSGNYVFTDNYGVVGHSYYRLKMVDYDGTFEYSKIQHIFMEYGKGEHIVFPNPAVDRVFFVRDYFDIVDYHVFDASGREVSVGLTREAGQYSFTLKSSSRPGLYFLVYKTAQQNVIHRKVMIK